MEKNWIEKSGDILSIFIPITVGAWLFFKVGHVDAAKFAFAYVLATIVTHTLKGITFAPRPKESQGEWIKWDISLKTGNSFPSGHTTSAMSGAVYAGYTLHPVSSFIFIVLAVIVAMSRVHAKAHFHRDVFYGYVIAQLTASAVFANLFGCATWLVRALG